VRQMDLEDLRGAGRADEARVPGFVVMGGTLPDLGGGGRRGPFADGSCPGPRLPRQAQPAAPCVAKPRLARPRRAKPGLACRTLPRRA
jgi:hypothetical protein